MYDFSLFRVFSLCLTLSFRFPPPSNVRMENECVRGVRVCLRENNRKRDQDKYIYVG